MAGDLGQALRERGRRSCQRARAVSGVKRGRALAGWPVGRGRVRAGSWLWRWLRWAEGVACGESWAARVGRVGPRAGKELAQVWAARGGKERKKGWAGEEGNGLGCGPWGKGKVGQLVGLPTGFGLVSLFFFWAFLSYLKHHSFYLNSNPNLNSNPSTQTNKRDAPA